MKSARKEPKDQKLDEDELMEGKLLRSGTVGLMINDDKSKNTPSVKPKKKTKNKILGTADYIAPEVLKGDEHTRMLDFWSLGVIMYEFMTGSLPFNDDSPDLIFKNILAR